MLATHVCILSPTNDLHFRQPMQVNACALNADLSKSAGLDATSAFESAFGEAAADAAHADPERTTSGPDAGFMAHSANFQDHFP